MTSPRRARRRRPRWRWTSCFSHAHAHIAGKNFRPTVRERYRQWLTHKLGTWVEQFGDSGCVGCGRCLTWCPAAIDLTEEVAVLRGAAETPP
ncbi:MAG: 4Fe-4S dicluster domain-containing protein [Candidatus Binatia bacterium]